MTTVVTTVERQHLGVLTPQFVRSVTRPGRYGDGYGSFSLSLHVRVGKRGRINNGAADAGTSESVSTAKATN